jgi:hypothetical protein
VLAAGDRGTEQQTFVSGIFLRRATALTSGLPWRGRPSGESAYSSHSLLGHFSPREFQMTDKRRARIKRLTTVGQVSAEMAVIYRKVRWGEIKPDDAKTFVTILAIIPGTKDCGAAEAEGSHTSWPRL